MADINVADVQSVYAAKEPSFDVAQRDKLVQIAERMTNDVFGGRIARLSEIEGDEDDFAAYLGAHLWAIAEGGQVSGQSQAGGNVNFTHLQTNIESTLSETTYGRVCLMMMRSKASIGLVRSDG